jgi:hypothetical protein
MSADITTICLVDAPPELGRAFEGEGYRVLDLKASPAPFFDLPAALAGAGFTPDLVLQVERLGVRSVLTGLDSLDCPLLFWAVDPHLNAHWHSAYARLFDVVCSTQKAWIPRLAERGAPDVRWLPWFGLDRTFNPWEERVHGLAFVGRVTDQRPARKWLVEYLMDKGAACNPAIRDSVPKAAMLDLYSRSKIIPNESIFGEVNFRLFEGACCGCLVLGQAIDEQAELFEPGREMDTYEHVVELDDKLAGYLTNDKLVRTMSRAAHARVRAEHLPVHRARRIVEYARAASRNRATGSGAAKWTALTAGAMWEAGVSEVGLKTVLDLLGGVDQDGDIMAATLRLHALVDAPKLLEENLKALLTRPTAGAPDLNLAASMAALRLNDFKWAKTFWYRHLEDGGIEPVPPESPNALYTLWARDLQRRGLALRPGFGFDPARHLPATAMECLMMVLEDTPQDLPTLRLMDVVLRPVFGTGQTRVGYLSILTLFERDDWRLALEIALADLAACRLESGLEEMHLARELAVKAGQEPAFIRVLKGRDPSGRIAARLGIGG